MAAETRGKYFLSFIKSLSCKHSGYLLFGILFVSLCQKNLLYTILGILASLLVYHSQKDIKEKKIHEFPKYMLVWFNIPILMCLISANARFLSHTIDFVLGSGLHDFIVTWFGLTPYLNTFPDFLAGAISMIPSIIIGTGIQGSRSLERMLNVLNIVLFMVLTASSIYYSNAMHKNKDEEYAYLLETSLSSSGLVMIVFTGTLINVSQTTRTTSTTTATNTAAVLSRAASTNRLSVKKTEMLSAHIYHAVAAFMIGVLTVLMPSNRCGDGLYVYFTNEQSPLVLRFLSLSVSVTAFCIAGLIFSFPLHIQIEELAKKNQISHFFIWKVPYMNTPFIGCISIGFTTSLLTTMMDISELVSLCLLFYITRSLAVNLISHFLLAKALGNSAGRDKKYSIVTRLIMMKLKPMLAFRRPKEDMVELVDNETAVDIIDDTTMVDIDITDAGGEDDIDKAFNDYKLAHPKSAAGGQSAVGSSCQQQLHLYLTLFMLFLTNIFSLITYYHESFGVGLSLPLKILSMVIITLIFIIGMYTMIRLRQPHVFIHVILSYFLYFEFYSLAFVHYVLFVTVLLWTMVGFVNFYFKQIQRSVQDRSISISTIIS